MKWSLIILIGTFIISCTVGNNSNCTCDQLSIDPEEMTKVSINFFKDRNLNLGDNIQELFEVFKNDSLHLIEEFPYPGADSDTICGDRTYRNWRSFKSKNQSADFLEELDCMDSVLYFYRVTCFLDLGNIKGVDKQLQNLIIPDTQISKAFHTEPLDDIEIKRGKMNIFIERDSESLVFTYTYDEDSIRLQ
ncbi:MAG: hypothetical protein IT258_13480 [Saprospiraceae bacterium]|nr:hypothetical protein [Saprospiraceae bacterium]